MKNNLQFVFAAGGTGGHLFPAIAVAEQIHSRFHSAEIHFIGRSDKLEAGIVPKYGYAFHSINVEGFSRKNIFYSLIVLLKFIIATVRTVILFMKLKPVSTLITGAYIGGPAVIAARILGSKIFMIEANSYPGLTIRLFERLADEIYLAFEDTKKYLRNLERAVLTGNPVRSSFRKLSREDAKNELGFDTSKKLIFITGGSLGAGKINETIELIMPILTENNIQCLWQTGSAYYTKYEYLNSRSIKIASFIDDMNLAMNACDLMIGRAGASTIAEVLTSGTAAVFIPSPNVTENHQYHNAKSVAEKNAGILIEEKELDKNIAQRIVHILNDSDSLDTIRKNAAAMFPLNSAEIITDRMMKIIAGTY